MANISFAYGHCLVTFPDGDPKELIEKINQVTKGWNYPINFSQVSHHSGLTYKCYFEAGGRWTFANLLEILGPSLYTTSNEETIKFLEEKEWFLCFEYLDHEPNNGVLVINQTTVEHSAGQPIDKISVSTFNKESFDTNFIDHYIAICKFDGKEDIDIIMNTCVCEYLVQYEDDLEYLREVVDKILDDFKRLKPFSEDVEKYKQSLIKCIRDEIYSDFEI